MSDEFKNEDNVEQNVNGQQLNEQQYNGPQLNEQQFNEQQYNGQQFSGQQYGDVNYNYYNSEQYEKAKQQVEKERIKFERKRAKAACKREKKEARKEAKKNKQGNGHGPFFKAVTLTVSAVAFGFISIGTIYLAGDKLGIFDRNESKTTTVISKTPVTNSNEDEGLTSLVASDSNNKVIVTDVSKIVEDVMPCIVAITSTQIVQSGGYGDLYEYFFGYGGNGGNDKSYSEQQGAGSGIIIGQNDSELLIVTNNHVVEGADSLTIQFIDDENVDAYVKGTSASNDLAVVAVKLSDIKESTLDAVKIATLGDSDALKVGEGTIAIGNALGYGQSVTTGVVSALNREVLYEDGAKNLIQTDAAINPGNSGGALLNMKGEVIGINAAKYSSSSIEGMGFAIPVSSVEDVINNLMNKETREKVSEEEKGYLNIYGRDVTEELSQMYGAPTGVLVVEVMEKGAAEKAGIEKSDVITAVNGQEVSSMSELSAELEYYKKGEKVKLTIQYIKDKSYVEKEVEVTLAGNME